MNWFLKIKHLNKTLKNFKKFILGVMASFFCDSSPIFLLSLKEVLKVVKGRERERERDAHNRRREAPERDKTYSFLFLFAISLITSPLTPSLEVANYWWKYHFIFELSKICPNLLTLKNITFIYSLHCPYSPSAIRGSPPHKLTNIALCYNTGERGKYLDLEREKTLFLCNG